MPYLGHVRNLAVEAITGTAQWLGLYEPGAKVSGWKSNTGEELEKTAHGIDSGSTGKAIIVVLKCTEGGAGSMFRKGAILFAKRIDANHIQVSQTAAGSPAGFIPEKWTSTVQGEVEVQEITEAGVVVSRSEYKRLKAKWNKEKSGTAGAEATRGVQTDAEEHKIKTNAGTPVIAVGWFTAETGGEVRVIEMAATEETVGESKNYTVTEAKFDFEGLTNA